MSAFDDALEQAEQGPRFQVPVRLLLDADAYNRSARLQAKLEALTPQVTLERAGGEDDGDITDGSPLEQARAVAAEMVALYEQHPPTEFVFEQLSALEFSDLDAKHDGDELWLHVMERSCVQPEGATVDGWRRWRSTLNAGQWQQLKASAEAAQWGLFDLRPTRAASVLTRGSRPRSQPPETGEPPDPGSSDV